METTGPELCPDTLVVNQTGERRSNIRYPVVSDIHFTVKRYQRRISGTGRSVNISSRGLLFWSGDILPLRGKIEIRLAWPARIDGLRELTLWIEGETIRSDGQYTAVHIRRYEFRLRGKF